MNVVRDPEIVDGFLKDESGLKGSATGVVRPRSAAEVREVVRECAAGRVKLLPVGAQTATTAAATPQDDLVLSLRGLSGVVDIDRTRQVAEVLPGTLTFDVKQAVEAEGLCYPPDPTSEHECTIGGNAATNASGARTFRWGMTSNWIAGLEVVTGTGELRRVFRTQVDKNTAGYLPLQDQVALFVGSEGTLGVITRLWLSLIPHPGDFAAFIVFFPSFEDALRVAADYRAGALPGSPRCVELFDAAALSLLSSFRRPPFVPPAAQSALYLELDLRARGLERLVGEELAPLARAHALLDATIVGQTAAEKSWIRELRHHIPETLNAMAAQFHAAGGVKVSIDFAVPPARFLEMMRYVDRTAAEAGVDYLVRYGHVGNAHPHIFMRGRDLEEVRRYRQVAHALCRQAAAFGGTVTGEHGVGKSRRDFLRYMYPPAVIAAMRAAKRAFDPADIFALGNIFPETPPLVPELEE